MSKVLDDKIIKQFKWYFKKGYITHRDGNAAYRVHGGYAVTASGIVKNNIKRTDFITVNAKGNVLESYGGKKPSIETGAHIALLETSGKNASVHVHSPNTVALAALYDNRIANGNRFKPRATHLVETLNRYWPELFRYTKVGYIVPFVEPGSKKLHDLILSHMEYWTEEYILDQNNEPIDSKDVKRVKDICIMQKHGVIAVGDTLEECLEHIVRLEHVCTILLKIVTASGNLESIL